jgi:LysR family transcriptional regulator, regulator for metE and metH
VPDIRLEVRDLQVVLALAAAGTTAKAASSLRLTQPAVSRALLAAEDKLGARLFDRTRRGLVPTPAGRDLLEGGAQLLAALGELEQRVRAPVTPPARIRLVCECYTAYHWLPSALATLRTALPELRISLGIEHTLDPVAALESGAIDVALLTTSKLPRGGLEEAPLFSDEVVFVLAPSHPLAAKKALTADDLRDTTLLSPDVPPGAARWFTSRVFGPRPPTTLRFQFLPLTEAILDLARAGMGVAVMSDWIAGPHLGKGDLVTRRLATGPMRRPWRIAWRREARDAAERLRAVVGGFVPLTPRRTDGTTRPAAASSATRAARRPARSPR